MLKLFYTEVKPNETRLKPNDLHRAAHECLRQGVLSCLTGLYAQNVRAVKLTLVTGEHGKPYLLSHPALEISLSHAGHIAMCALSEQALGVDVQDHRPLTTERMQQLARRFYAPEEQMMPEKAGTVPEHDDASDAQKNRFFRIWAAKEAYAKYTGKGLAEDFPSFYADFDGMVIRRSSDNAVLGCLYEPLSLPGYSCMVCTEEPVSAPECVCVAYGI